MKKLMLYIKKNIKNLWKYKTFGLRPRYAHSWTGHGNDKTSNKYIIHTVGPRYTTGENGETEKLKSAYYESLKLAKIKGIRKIAFPSISTGIYRFPVDEGAKIALSTAIKFLDENPNTFDLILWVLDEKTYVIYEEKYKKLIEI